MHIQCVERERGRLADHSREHIHSAWQPGRQIASRTYMRNIWRHKQKGTGLTACNVLSALGAIEPWA